MRKFMVLTTQRSGSSFLGRSLNSHSKICCHGEIFLKKLRNEISYRSYRTQDVKRKFDHLFRRKALISSYIEELSQREQGCEAFGFKFMYGQARRYPQVIEWAKEQGVSVVHLIRHNALKVIVSRKVAKERGVYLSTEPLRPIKIELDTGKLISEIKKLHMLVQMYQESFYGLPYMEVTYEDVMSDYDGEFGRILEFLGVRDNEELDCDLVKTGGGSLADVVTNFDDVSVALKKAGYGEFLA